MQDVYLGDRNTLVSATLFSCNNNEHPEISKAKYDKSNYYLTTMFPQSHSYSGVLKNQEFIKYAHTH